MHLNGEVPSNSGYRETAPPPGPCSPGAGRVLRFAAAVPAVAAIARPVLVNAPDRPRDIKREYQRDKADE